MRPQIGLTDLAAIIPTLQQQLNELPPLRKEEIIESVEIAIKYAGYIARERAIADKLQRLEHIPLRGKVDYNAIHTLSTEARQKLTRIDPETIGQAARIPGISPNDINVLLLLLGEIKFHVEHPILTLPFHVEQNNVI